MQGVGRGCFGFLHTLPFPAAAIPPQDEVGGELNRPSLSLGMLELSGLEISSLVCVTVWPRTHPVHFTSMFSLLDFSQADIGG